MGRGRRNLAPYAAGFRYPGDILDPEMDEVEEVLAVAESIVNFVT